MHALLLHHDGAPWSDPSDDLPGNAAGVCRPLCAAGVQPFDIAAPALLRAHTPKSPPAILLLAKQVARDWGASGASGSSRPRSVHTCAPLTRVAIALLLKPSVTEEANPMGVCACMCVAFRE